MHQKKPKIDLERVRAKADQSIDLGVTTEYTMIPIRNPKPDEFFRCMPDEEYSMDAHILSLKTENEWYMIDPDILPQIQLESQLRDQDCICVCHHEFYPICYLYPTA